MFRIFFIEMGKKEAVIAFVMLSFVFAAFILQAGEVIETKNVLLKFSLSKGDMITKS